MNVLQLLALIAAIWIPLSLIAGLVIGPLLKRHPPQPK